MIINQSTSKLPTNIRLLHKKDIPELLILVGWFKWRALKAYKGDEDKAPRILYGKE
jgi:hypothetical protein